MQDINFGNYVYFVYTGTNKRYSFSTYTDKETGNTMGYRIGTDKNGEPKYKTWDFNYDSKFNVRVNIHEKDLDGKSAVEFLKNAPDCEGSKNGHYDPSSGQQYLTYFKEANEEKDAEKIVDARLLVVEAMSAAAALKGKELDEFAAIIGVFGDKPKIKVQRVLDFASNYPKKMLELINDPTRSVKALVERAINAGVFSQDGKIIKWENKTIGADKDEAISNVLKDEKLRKAIELNLAKFGG